MGVQVEDEWRLRKVRNERASKSAFAYKINRKLKEKASSKMSYGYGHAVPYSQEVIVKITGGARSKKGISGSIHYISKEGELELVDSNGIAYKTKEEVADAIGLLQEHTSVSTRNHNKKEQKLTQNIVFSSPCIAHVTKEDALKTVALTLKEKYSDNYFVMSYHNETKNSHVHVVLNIHNDIGTRINIRKKDLREIREGYCQHLVHLGYEVKATRKYDQELKNYHELSLRENKNIYEVVDFGTASYQFDKKNEKNGYLVYKTANNRQVKIWGKELLNQISQNNIQQGDLIKIKKVGHTIVKVPVYGDNSKTILFWKETKRNQWQIEKVDGQLHLSQVKHKQEIKLDTPQQAEKQWAQREKFNEERNVVLNKLNEKDYNLVEELKYKPPSHKFKF